MLLALAAVATGTALLLAGLAVAAAMLSSQCSRHEERQPWQGRPPERLSVPPPLRRSA